MKRWLFEGEEGNEEGKVPYLDGDHLFKKEGLLWKKPEIKLVLSINEIGGSLAANSWLVFNGVLCHRYLAEKIHPRMPIEEVLQKEEEHFINFSLTHGLEDGRWNWNNALSTIFEL